MHHDRHRDGAWVRYYEEAERRRRFGYQDPLSAYWHRQHKRDRLLAVALGAVQLLVLAGAYFVLSQR